MTRTALLGGLACFVVGVGAGAGWVTWRSAAHETRRPASGGEDAAGTGPRHTSYAPLKPYVRQEAPQTVVPAMETDAALTSASPQDVAADAAPQRPWWRDNGRGGGPWGGDSNRPPWFASPEEMKARAQALRSNFIEHAKLDEGQTMRLDVLVAAMNLRLREKADEWKEFATNDVLPRSELRTRVMNDISSVMVLTYDEMDRTLPEGWREAAGPQFSLNALIDPNIMQDLRPVMGRGMGRWRGGGPDQGGRPANDTAGSAPTSNR